MSHIILVTGAAGYIGSIATELLLKEGYTVIAVDDLSTGHKESLFKEIPFYNLKVGDKDSMEKVFTENKIDLVLHIAGAALVEESMKNPLKYFDINFCQGQNLLDTMIRFNIKKFVFSSTCAVYGIPDEKNIPIKETTPTKPINIYGQSKLLFELALEWYKKQFDIDYIALRYFNVAGASENRGEKHNPETHLIPLIIKSVKNKDFELTLYGNDYPTKDGTAVRDYIHVIDLINAHIRALEILINEKKHLSVYNIGYGEGVSVLEIVNAAKEVFKKDIPYKMSGRRPGDPPQLIADSFSIRSDLHWQPKHNNIHEIISSASRFI